MVKELPPLKQIKVSETEGIVITSTGQEVHIFTFPPELVEAFQKENEKIKNGENND